MKKLLRVAASLAPGLIALSLFCSNPTDQSLKWRSKIEMPVSNQKFFIKQMMHDMFSVDSNTKFLGSDDTTKLVDTLAYETLQKSTIQMTYKADDLNDKVFHSLLGPIPLTGLAAQTMSLPLNQFSPVVSAFKTPTIADTLSIPRIRSITFDNSSPALPIQVTNTTSLPIDSINLKIVSATYNGFISHLDAGASATINYPVAGYSFRSLPNHDSALIIMQMSAKIGAGTIGAGRGLSCRFSFNNMTLSNAIVKDSLISFSNVFTNQYKISDSVDLDNVDIGSGFFYYNMKNYSGLDFDVKTLHEDLWITLKCAEKTPPVEKKVDLARMVSDSQSAFNGVIGQFTISAHDTANASAKQPLNISACRLFPEWDTVTNNSITTVHYYVKSRPPSGQWDTVTSNDAVVFTIHPSAIHFSKMNGTIVKPFVKQSDTTRKAIPFMWSKASKDSLRDKFFLSSVKTAVDIGIDVPAGAMIQHFVVKFTVTDPAYPALPCTLTTTLDSVVRNKIFHDTIDITKIVNKFPDSVSMFMRGEVPIGTGIKIVNDSALSSNTGQMVLNGNVDYKMIAKLDWTVSNDVALDMGSGKFKVDAAIKTFDKLQKMTAAFNMNLTNNTNIYGTLYALLDPKIGRRQLLDSMTTGQFFSLVDTAGKAERNGYINLLSSLGTVLPDRDSIKAQFNTISLKPDQLDLLMNTDSCYMRWVMKFRTNPRDAMRNSDYAKIDSWISIEGINSMDSLASFTK